MWQCQCLWLLRSNGSHPCNKRSLSFYLGALGRMNVYDMLLLYLVLHSRSGVVPQVCPCPVFYINPTPVYHLNWFGIHNHWINMSLTTNDKKVVKTFWCKVSSQADTIGIDALGRWVQPHLVRRWRFIYVFHIPVLSTPVAQVAAGVPTDQELLLPLGRTNSQLCWCQETWRPHHCWSDAGHG